MGRRDHLTFRGNVAIGRHGWLRLTPAYSLHLVRELLKQSGPDETVLEPFSGTGTTPLACASLGIRCDAVDINPFLVWLGNLKLTRFDNGTARAVKSAAGRIAEKARNPRTAAWKPDLHQIEKWWDAPTLHTLAALCDGIRKPPRERAAGVSDLLSVAFCRVMIQSANVSFGHQSMSFKKNGEGGGLVPETPAHAAERIAAAFVTAANEVADSLDVEPPTADCRVVLGDSRDLSAALPAGKQRYTAVITSPPYPNRMSYIRELRPYMYWLGYLSDGRAAGELDWKAIGGTWGCATSLLNSWKPSGPGEIPFPEFNRIIREISAGHMLLGRYVHKYFEDIKAHIVSLRKVLAPGARCHYIVGNSKFYDTVLPVEDIYTALFEDAGFVDVRVETIRKRTSKKELYEFIVHARALSRDCRVNG
ncbi:MAG: SAM-dependent methyltransferase [Phycisphaerae bacterium]|nr:MAG: site-specific DNA-methyltransferase [Planctomycetota bacterium]KAB2949206.1 MAG: site-specific DNA-methyltransferase [Phycisphaerae bacterium]MBE7458689.1 site-specific DNA-methyltransferase [Planctomycetia bacterium]MCL4719775.1 SAM-dependent methyltransferase [Phycisphaerae bacterium]MCQ3921985.1 SAM-dependent methyltransferase [Planctomycetota bacterium]